MHKIRPRHKKWQRNPDVHSGHVGAHHPIPMFSYICGWKNAHSCTLPGPKIGGDCDHDDQKALFKKGLPSKTWALQSIGAHQDMVHLGHWLSSGAPQALTFVVGEFLHLVWAGLAPKRENCPIMIR